MNLHLDKDAFKVLIEDIHNKTGYRTDVLEKDYYVVLILKELAEKQSKGLPAYFKGGTALYKALKMTNRFSEDIDLSVDTRECSRTQNDKRLKEAAKMYSVLDRDSSMGKTNRSEVVSVYRYNPIAAFDENDALQRFGFVKIEATSFTISEPVEILEVAPMIYDFATEEQRMILEKEFKVNSFPVMTITLERIFIDKLFAAESFVRKADDSRKAFEAAKHIYDLAVMEKLLKIERLLLDEENMHSLLNIRMEEERNRLDGIPNVLPNDFTFFINASRNKSVRKAYETMQRQYVLQEENIIEFDDACYSMLRIRDRLLRNKSWREFCISMDMCKYFQIK